MAMIEGGDEGDDEVFVDASEFYSLAASSGSSSSTFVDGLKKRLAGCKLSSASISTAPILAFSAAAGRPQTAAAQWQQQSLQSRPSPTHHRPRSFASTGGGGTGTRFSRIPPPPIRRQQLLQLKPEHSLLGLLNKVSPRNLDTLFPTILEVAASRLGTKRAAPLIIKHAIKQPVYMSLFVRIMQGIAARNESDHRLLHEAVDAVLSRHCGTPFVSVLTRSSHQHKGGHGSSEYDDFCERNKCMKDLLATVAFAIDSLRARLSSAYALHDYVGIVFGNFDHVTTSADLEALLDVVSVLVQRYYPSSCPSASPPNPQRGCGGEGEGEPKATIRNSLMSREKDFRIRGLVTMRAHFKILDILDALGKQLMT